MPDAWLDVGRGLDHRREIDAGLDAEAIEHVNQILSGEVAGRSGRVADTLRDRPPTNRKSSRPSAAR